MPRHRLSPAKVTCFACWFALSFAVAAVAQTPANQAYENEQRAVRLLQFDKEISSIPEPELRIPLRFNILEFIYTNEVRSQYAAVEPLMSAYFQDLKALEKTLVPGTSYQKNRISLLLRKHYPEMAKIVEAKYMIQVDTSGEDYEELRKEKDPNEIVDRAIERLKNSNSLASASNIYDSARRRSPELGARLLNAALESAEKNPTPDNASWLERLTTDVLNPPPPEVTPVQMLRYYKILVMAARSELSRAYPTDYFVRTSWPLRRALPNIEKVDPRLYSEGRVIVANYRKFLSKEQVTKEEADDRIEGAPDKLAQAIKEAETASTVELKDYYWSRAAQIASPTRDGDHKPAVDLLMKATPTVGTSDPKSRDQRLRIFAYWAQVFRDYEGAKYAVDRIQDDQIRANALLAYANRLGQMNFSERPKAAAIADDAIRQIEKTGPTDRSVCDIGNSRSLMTLLTPFTNINDLTTRTVQIINEFPSNITKAEPGTTERSEFVTLSTRSMILCSGFIFHPVWTSSAVPNPELANEIKAKEWRLAAQIEAEKYRNYPLTQ